MRLERQRPLPSRPNPMDSKPTMSLSCCSSRFQVAPPALLVLGWMVLVICMRRNRQLKLRSTAYVLVQGSPSFALTCSRRRRHLMLVMCNCCHPSAPRALCRIVSPCYHNLSC
jgi:hypothetical protein